MEIPSIDQSGIELGLSSLEASRNFKADGVENRHEPCRHGPFPVLLQL
jgi:hypothetical protein